MSIVPILIFYSFITFIFLVFLAKKNYFLIGWIFIFATVFGNFFVILIYNTRFFSDNETRIFQYIKDIILSLAIIFVVIPNFNKIWYFGKKFRWPLVCYIFIAIVALLLTPSFLNYLLQFRRFLSPFLIFLFGYSISLTTSQKINLFKGIVYLGAFLGIFSIIENNILGVNFWKNLQYSNYLYYIKEDINSRFFLLEGLNYGNFERSADDGTLVFRSASFFADVLSAGINFSLFASIGLSLIYFEKGKNILIGFLTILSLFGLYYSYTRSGWIHFLFVIFMLSLVSIKNKNQKNKFIILIILIILIFTILNTNDIIKLVVDTISLQEGSSYIHYISIMDFFNSIKQFKFNWGNGFDIIGNSEVGGEGATWFVYLIAGYFGVVVFYWLFIKILISVKNNITNINNTFQNKFDEGQLMLNYFSLAIFYYGVATLITSPISDNIFGFTGSGIFWFLLGVISKENFKYEKK